MKRKVGIEQLPKPPIGRVNLEGCTHFCKKCGSSTPKNGFLGLFGERFCINPKCINSENGGKCSTCVHNDNDNFICTVGTFHAQYGLDVICFNGEKWESKL